MAVNINETDLSGKARISSKDLKNTYRLFNHFLQEYREKPENISNVEWIERCIGNSMPELTSEKIKKYANETFESVKSYNETFREINRVTSGGISKEVWFANNIVNTIEQSDNNACGNYLSSLDEAIAIGNARSLNEPIGIEGLTPQENIGDWNAITIKDVALHMGKNAVLVGLQTLTKPDEAEMFVDVLGDEEPCIDREDILLSDQDISLKSAMTVALKAGIENKWLPFVPGNTSINTIANVSCMGVERMIALSRLASGEYTVSQVLEHMGKASITMFYNLCSKGVGDMIRIALSTIPIVGPALCNIVGAILTVAVDKKIREVITTTAEKVKFAAETAVKTVWSTVKNTGQKIKNKVKSFCNFLFS